MRVLPENVYPLPAESGALDLHFTPSNGVADVAIEDLMDLVGSVRHRDLVREMILAALKAGQEGGSRADLKLMNTTLKEMRFTTKVFGPYRTRRKVTVFGSARTAPSDPAYRMAQDLGRRLAESGHMLITGGGPGVMQAVNEGAGPEMSFGVRIRLPFEERTNGVLRGNPRLITYKYFFNRKVAFLKEADAVVLLPGGFGTLDEAMEVLCLVQTGKQPPMPLILLEPPGGTYWAEAEEFFRNQLVERGYIEAADLKLFARTDSVAEAVASIQRFYRRYHSLRYVDGRLLMRLQEPLAPPRVEALRREFVDLLVEGGTLYQGAALPQEADQPELAGLPRLIVDFDRRHFARLRALIDAVNE